jgi:hypothetical protein
MVMALAQTACRWERRPQRGRGYHAVARLIRKHSRGSLTYQPSKHQLATFRKMKFNASIVTINARTTDPSTALRR